MVPDRTKVARRTSNVVQARPKMVPDRPRMAGSRQDQGGPTHVQRGSSQAQDGSRQAQDGSRQARGGSKQLQGASTQAYRVQLSGLQGRGVWESLRLPGSPGGREECVAVQGLSESWGLSGSPAELPGQSGTPWDSREVCESLGIGDQRSGQCMEETLVYHSKKSRAF